MSKIEHSTSISPFPMGVTLIGSQINGQANFMVCAWVTRVNFKPSIWAAAINKNHATFQAIKNTSQFSINIPSTDMVEKTDYCGMISGKREDKSSVFEIFYDKERKIPMIKECPISIECKVRKIVDLSTNALVIGEIIAVHTEKQYLSEGKLDLQKIDPILLSMPENKYWSIGGYLADAWNVGKKLKRQLKS